MDVKQIEKKWQDKWDALKINNFNPKSNKKKYYCLEMFSYPSGAKLHIGHWYNYGLSDSFARFKKMKGFEVFQPMGFDAFGLPAENYAIKTGIHPQDSTLNNIQTMEVQLKSIGAMFDWTAEIKTCMPDYYKWTQWMFLKFFEKGLAYRKEAPVNWCPKCQTVLANEQVQSGECERCGTPVERKNLTQWFLKITEYAEELLKDLDNLDWPEKTKMMQRNWIGKSVGGSVIFDTEKGKEIEVFTTRADTLYGVSYVVLAPEHPLVDEFTTSEQKTKVEEYKAFAKRSTEIERLASNREKTGVFTGSYAINPINNKKVPIYVADYVLYTYGTGAVMGVPAHDERDFVFAQKYNLPITRVIDGNGKNDELPFVENGVLTNSGEFSGLSNEKAKLAILEKLHHIKAGGQKTNYRLRDWLVSRQRYWGAPIPIIHCPDCGEVAVPYENLPVELPYNVEFKPDGKSPLAKCESFINTTCPKCGKPAKRDADTLDTFVCSSWYYLRYADAKNNTAPFDKEKIDKMLPVDKYIGGSEHACMHLLYARFFTKALRDMGYLNFDEPFLSLIHQGLILGPDGEKMSKSKGNVISPDDYIKEYGSDVFRLYLMFGFNYTEGGAWNDNGIKAVQKFVERAERILTKIASINGQHGTINVGQDKELNFVRHNSIKKINDDLDVFSFNTAIARLMEFINALYKYDVQGNINTMLFKDAAKDFIKLIAPLAPHFAEEMWEKFGLPTSVFLEKYPVADEKYLIKDDIEIAVQINSKVKAKIMIKKSYSNEKIKEIALAVDSIKTALNGQEPKKIIVIPMRLVNIIV